ncbi:MAG TPA: amino acid adenylation domain-containing protein [Bryobacteraceae bacterium]
MKNVEDIYPLSPMQQGMLFHTLLAPEAGDYLTQLTGTIEGGPSLNAFRDAWREVIHRHALLRTGFVWETLDQPLQIVHRQTELPWSRQDWRNRTDASSDFDRFLAKDRAAGFDLASPPLMRLSVFEVDDNVFRFVWTHHHLLLDGWSLPLLMKELFGFVEASLQGREVRFPSPRPYRDYIAWLDKRNESSAESYWRGILSGFTAPTAIGAAATTASKATRSHAEIRRSLSADVTAALTTMVRQNHLTLNTLVQGAWALLLHHHSAESDIVFGATVSGRPADLAGVESMIGLFINTQPVCVKVDRELGIIPWLVSLQAEQTQARQFEYCRLTSIHGWSDVPRTMPLFESIVIFENYPAGLAGGSVESLGVRDIGVVETTSYPLALIAAPGRELELRLNYDSARFEAATVERMACHLETLLQGIALHPEMRVAELPVMDAREQRMILDEWNQTEVPFPADRRLDALFIDQVRRTPDAVALAFEGQTLTYAELNNRADRIAAALQNRGVAPETVVAIALDRSPEMIVAILGVLKADGAWLPVGIDQPADRISFLLEDAAPAFIIGDPISRNRFPQSVHANLLDYDDLIRHDAGVPVKNTASPSNLAYVIYTSGSTGRPKGVLIEHRGAVNLAIAQAKLFGVGGGSCVLQFAAPTFDAAVSEIFVTLLNGGKLLLARREQLLGPDLATLLHDGEVNVVTLPPSVLATIPEVDLPDLHTLVVAGEACPPELVRRWARGRRIVNAYGPTETTVCATAGECDGDQRITIGRPIDNVRVYLVDENRKPVPIGVPGELLVGGIGVARGYLNRPELTAQRFIEDSFAEVEGARMYRTGDRARFLGDGRIEYLGRLDRQVKIRGFRIEPGEIEAALLETDAVGEAIVIAGAASNDSTAHKRLLAYITPRKGAEVVARDLRKALQAKLPAYMIPSAFIVLEQFPLTAHGKIDRVALERHQKPQSEMEISCAPPRNDVEQVLADIWRQVLNLPRIGIHENFFDAGGHSLLALQLVSRIREDLGADLPLAAVFRSPTIAALGECLLQDVTTRAAIEQTAQLILRAANLSDDELESLVAAELAA